MPCTYDYFEEDPESLYDEPQNTESQKNKRKYGRRITTENLLTEVACEACRIVENNKLSDTLSPLAKKWWRNHQIEDAKKQVILNRKREKEEIKKKALAKLSDKERKALGLI